MDEFDIIDLVYNHVEAAATGLKIYKDKSATGESESHIVINHLEFHEQDWQNVLPVNVNIFIKLNSNGMPDRQKLKEAKRKIRIELLKIKTENGQYRNSEINGSVTLPALKEGFDCINIKLTIKTEIIN